MLSEALFFPQSTLAAADRGGSRSWGRGVLHAGLCPSPPIPLLQTLNAHSRHSPCKTILQGGSEQELFKKAEGEGSACNRLTAPRRQDPKVCSERRLQPAEAAQEVNQHQCMQGRSCWPHGSQHPHGVGTGPAWPHEAPRVLRKPWEQGAAVCDPRGGCSCGTGLVLSAAFRSCFPSVRADLLSDYCWIR